MIALDFIEQSPETKPFWDAASVGRFVLPYCQQCRRKHWYPRGFCPHCLSTGLDWVSSDGDGEIYSFCVNRQNVPYVLAYVQLKEGLILLSNVVHSDPATLSIGTKVQVVFEAAPGNVPVPLFAVR